MKCNVFLIALLLNSFFCSIELYSQSKSTICNGNWNINSIWEGSFQPIPGDTIIINHYIILNQIFELNNNVLIIDENAELYINYDFTITSGSKIINYGRLIAPKFIFLGSLLNYGKTITDDSYQDYFQLSTCTPVVIAFPDDILKANVLGYKYEWYNNNVLLEEDSLQYLSIYTTGNYKCRYKKTEYDSYSDYSESVYIEVEVIDTNVIDTVVNFVAQNSQPDDLLIYPIPTSDILNIETDSRIDNIYVFDITGQLKLQTNEKTFDIESFDDGIFLLRIQMNNNLITRKITKY